MFITDDDKARPDWELLANGAVTLFWRKQLFEEAKAAVRSLGYHVVEVACATSGQFAAELGSGLNWAASSATSLGQAILMRSPMDCAIHRSGRRGAWRSALKTSTGLRRKIRSSQTQFST